MGTALNAIDNNPGFNTTARLREITLIAGNDVTLDDVTDIAVDYWLALEGYSPIAQVPVELQQLLVQGAALEILKSLGDTEGYQKLEIEYKDLTKFCMNAMTPRSDGNPKKAIGAGNTLSDWCGF